ncbi:hypothetical protein DIPPA_24814 [Diplonema papillatum]|nr:hypothetical protein DIPPA_24814 [Diplonema papillatum]
MYKRSESRETTDESLLKEILATIRNVNEQVSTLTARQAKLEEAVVELSKKRQASGGIPPRPGPQAKDRAPSTPVRFTLPNEDQPGSFFTAGHRFIAGSDCAGEQLTAFPSSQLSNTVTSTSTHASDFSEDLFKGSLRSILDDRTKVDPEDVTRYVTPRKGLGEFLPTSASTRRSQR